MKREILLCTLLGIVGTKNALASCDQKETREAHPEGLVAPELAGVSYFSALDSVSGKMSALVTGENMSEEEITALSRKAEIIKKKLDSIQDPDQRERQRKLAAAIIFREIRDNPDKASEIEFPEDFTQIIKGLDITDLSRLTKESTFCF